MKTLFILILLSSPIFASTYKCQTRWLQLDLDSKQEMTNLTVRDFHTGEYYYTGFVSEIIDRDGLTDLMFETRPHTFLKLQFKTDALTSGSDKLYGFIQGWTGGGFEDGSLLCYKKSI